MILRANTSVCTGEPRYGRTPFGSFPVQSGSIPCPGKVSSSHNNSLVPRACQWNLSVIIFGSGVPPTNNYVEKKKDPNSAIHYITVGNHSCIMCTFPQGAQPKPHQSMLFLCRSSLTLLLSPL